MVCALWWAWVSTTWVTNWLDPVTLPLRGAVVALGFVALVMSVSIAEAFGDRAWAVAISYVVLQIGRTGFIVWATLRHDRRVAHSFALILGWTVVGGALWIVGAVLPHAWQLPLWTAALALELIGTILGCRVANQKIGGRRAHGDESSLLDVDRGSPLLTMERVAYDDAGRPVEVGQHCYRPDRYSFETTLVAR